MLFQNRQRMVEDLPDLAVAAVDQIGHHADPQTGQGLGGQGGGVVFFEVVHGAEDQQALFHMRRLRKTAVIRQRQKIITAFTVKFLDFLRRQPSVAQRGMTVKIPLEKRLSRSKQIHLFCSLRKNIQKTVDFYHLQ